MSLDDSILANMMSVYDDRWLQHIKACVLVCVQVEHIQGHSPVFMQQTPKCVLICIFFADCLGICFLDRQFATVYVLFHMAAGANHI